MTNDDKKQLENDVRNAINQAMASVHKKWSKQVPSEELRIIVCRLMTDRAFEAALEAVEKALRPSRKMDTLIQLLKFGHTAQQAAQLIDETE